MKFSSSKTSTEKASKAIAKNQLQRNKGLHQGLSIEDNRVESLNNKALQRDYDFCNQQKTIQRLKIYPENETEFAPEQPSVDLDKATYKKLSVYLSKREEQKRSLYFFKTGVDGPIFIQEPIREGDIESLKKARGLANKNYYFESGDIAKIKELIKKYETGDGKEKVDTVICNEGNIKVADSDQKVDFGNISSCLTINVYLKNGKKVVAHLGLEAIIPLSEIRKVIDEQDSEVEEINIIGVLRSWTPLFTKRHTIKGFEFIDNGSILKNKESKLECEKCAKSQLGGEVVNLEEFEGDLTVVKSIEEQKKEKLADIRKMLANGEINKQEARAYQTMIINDNDFKWLHI